jgi:A nuclease family of the HNH/ENDO VII superfamily with conserved AHH
MEIGEMIAVAFIQDQLEKCPFVIPTESDNPSFEDESIKDDDKKAAKKEQANDGGILGKNLVSGSTGAKGTVAGDYPPDSYLFKSPQFDTKRSPKCKTHVFVAQADEHDAAAYPFTVAAHHLIPGNASLYKGLFQRYLKKGETVKTSNGKSWTIKNHIGYNVNGSHNGVWLPGNYAIDEATSPEGKPWSELTNQNWCLNYVAATIKATGGQFHDAHTEYNESVSKLLLKITSKLHAHQLHCEECESKKGKEISPPHFVKERLYGLSNYLRGQVTGSPLTWKRPWFTSDKWRNRVFSPIKLNAQFVEAYTQARVIQKV